MKARLLKKVRKMVSIVYDKRVCSYIVIDKYFGIEKYRSSKKEHALDEYRTLILKKADNHFDRNNRLPKVK